MTDGPDVSRLSPSDAVAALRSYPRRFRALLTTFDNDESPDDLVHRTGPDRLSALDHADRAARVFALLGNAARSVLVEESPVLAPAVLEHQERDSIQPAGPGAGIASVSDLLELEARHLAETAERVSADDWNRIGTIAGSGQQVRAIDLVREAVRSGSLHLRAAEAAIEAARRA
jgi:hypothetical protein